MKSAFHQLLDKIRLATAETTQTDKGQRFEVLIQRFFQQYPTYKERFSEVFLWSNWPYRGSHGDIGIDLVAKEAATDRYVAIQCKCYDDTHVLSERDVKTFFGALGMEWSTDNGAHDTFAGGIVVATCYYWSNNLLDMLHKQTIPCQHIGLSDLEGFENIDWDALQKGKIIDIPKNNVRDHQREAIDAVLEKFNSGTERGKMIMACGTGKTFTALRLTEEYTQGKGCVLFLAPSIALVSQSLREWMCQTTCKLHPIAVCSDAQVGRVNELHDLAASDLPSPATTDPAAIANNYQRFKDSHLTVIFSTYQSLDKVIAAQSAGALPEFDLTICDEAHRTAGASLLKADGEMRETDYRRVHEQKFLKSKKRLYMTATPKVYGDAVHEKAKQTEGVLLADMNDETIFGEELFNLPFSRAVRENLLTDYKVLVLCVDEDYVRELMHERLVKKDNGQFELEDAVKLVGCYNGLRKKMISGVSPYQYAEEILCTQDDDDAPFNPELEDTHEDDFKISDPAPMLRAVSFAGRIKDSLKYAELWANVVEAIKKEEEDDTESTFLPSVMQHVDGDMHMGERERLLHWLKEPTGGESRVLTNAQCLSEGVDVPALDAIMFLAPKKSQIDIVQSVGRVMRRDPAGNKKYGYIIIPIGIPREADAADMLDKDERFKVVWQILQALRSHDDRFAAEINALDFNKRRSKHVNVVGVSGKKLRRNGDDKEAQGSNTDENGTEGVAGEPAQGTLDLIFSQTVGKAKEAIFTKMVQRCGEKPYWEKWATEIAAIAARQQQAIEELSKNPEYSARFNEFVNGLKENIRPDISMADAVEMLSMQLVSRPVFNALFAEYEFAEKNPVSQTMNAMLDFVEEKAAQNDTKALRKFYNDVKSRAEAITTTKARQEVIRELYENFFQTAFKKLTDKLGIVYTPVEVVDFIIHSVHKVLQKEFKEKDGIGASGVRILDPFTGTGTFIVRAIQSGLIKRSDLPRKYKEELFASEIVLLAYYIACINIEVAYHGAVGQQEYEPFEGIALTDTFMMHENSAKDEDLFPQFEDNGERVKRLCKQDIRVIIGNPPYSAKQQSANDNNQNTKYPKLDARIAETYAASSQATNKNSLYDSYIRAFRWGSDCIKGDGVLAFVSNGAYIDNNAMVGFRESLMDEFSSIYCFNLRGNQRTSGELSRKEGGKIFGSGSRTPIAIIVLVKKADHKEGQRATLYYHDIGDYLSREDKLKIVKDAVDITGLKWEKLVPDEHGDWVNHRTQGYENYTPLGDKETKGKANSPAIFQLFSRGIATSRDSWAYNFSRKILENNIKRSIEFFNGQTTVFLKQQGLSIDEFITYDKTKFVWGVNQKKDAANGVLYLYNKNNVRFASYRPFCKSHVYFAKELNERRYQMQKLFPTVEHKNILIGIHGLGSKRPFSSLIFDSIPDLNILEAGVQCFPLYWYEKREERAEDGMMQGMMDLGMEASQGDYIRKDGITDYALKEFKAAYGDPKIGKEDIFYYVYGLLHSEEYRTQFENDLKKEMPRIPRVKKFWEFSKAGRALAELHLNYETVEPYPVTEESKGNFRIEDKMRFPKKGIKDIIIYNSSTIIRDIPKEAYEYIVNGKSAIEWIMERYAVTTDKDSGIVNDPNLWCDEHNNPRYIIDLLKRVITVSIETVKIVKALPKMEIL